MKFLHSRNGTIVLGAVLGVFAVGYVMKKSREEIKAGKPVAETWAGKVGLLG